MKTMYLGNDAHGKYSMFIGMDRKGNQTAKIKVPTTQEGYEEMKRRAEAPDGTKVGLETGPTANYAVKLLRQVGLEPILIDAREVRVKARRPTQKDDWRDAFELCDGVRRDIYTSIVHIPSVMVERLRKWLSRRAHFVRLRVSQVNAAKRVLRAEGIGGIDARMSTRAAWEKLLKRPDLTGDLLEHVGFHYQAWLKAQEAVQRIEQELEQMAKEHFHEPVELLETIPGVGLITATTAVAVLSDVQRFPSVKNAASYVGLVPQTYQSGETERHGHITKRGNAQLRSLLVEAAHHARSARHPLHPYFALLTGKRGHKLAAVAVAHRLLRIMVAMLKNHTAFDVSKLNVEKKMVKVTKTYHYVIKRTARKDNTAA